MESDRHLCVYDSERGYCCFICGSFCDPDLLPQEEEEANA